MTQSGVSQHIRKLESQLGTELLIREGKRFSLSDAGETLYRSGREVLRSLYELSDQVSEDPAFEGLVRIASPGSIGLKLYPWLLSLQERHRSLVIDYRFAPNEDVQRLILERSVDLGLMTRPAAMTDVSSRPIAEEPLLLVTPEGVSDPHWGQLMALGFIDHPDGAHHAGLLLGPNYPEFRHCGQFPRSGFSNQIMLILEPVSRGLGFTVLPAHAVQASHLSPRLQVHQLARPISETLYLVQHARRAIPARVHSVVDEIHACLEPGSVAAEN